MPTSRPPVTGTTHPLPFLELSPTDFERLCYALVEREGYEALEHLGAAGQDEGCDILAFHNGERVIFQCKRHPRLGPAQAEAAVDEILALPAAERPVRFVLVVAGAVSKETRRRLRQRAGGIATEVWDRTFLEERVYRYPELRARFFRLPGENHLNLKRYLSRRVLSTGRTGEVALLSAYSFSVPLIGRETVLADLWNWMKNDRPISVRVMTARAGTGKTRLALELCDQAVDAGWEAGCLSEIPDRRTSWGWAGPTLVVVDYAASRVEPLRKWLIELADHSEQKGSPLRVLLLERHADPSGGWWRETFGVGGGDAEAVKQLLDPVSGPCLLPPLVGPNERRAVLGSILERIGSTVRLPEPGASPRFESRLAEISWGGEPLFLLMAGLVAGRAGFGEVLALSATDLGFQIARHEIHRIHEIARAREIPGVLLAHLAAFVTLCQGLSQTEVEGLVEEEARALGCSAGAGPLAVYEALAAALPGERGAVAAILPDVVGEAVVLEALGGGAAEKALMAVSRAAQQFGERLSASLIHLAQDYGADRPEPVAWFERLVAEWAVDLSSLATLVDQLPESTLALREAAAVLTKHAVELARQRGDGEELAWALSNLANRLSAVGRREEALAASEEAVKLYRVLATSRPDACRPDLAMALSNLSNHLNDLGRQDDALAASEEATKLYRALAVLRSAVFLPGLAMSLNNLSAGLITLRRLEAALEASQEAVEVYRDLAVARPNAFRPNLAASLITLAACLRALRRREEALAASDEAVELYRDLSASRPDAFRPELAKSLDNLSTYLGALARCEEALTASEEAIRLYRGVSASRPDAFRAELAISLNNLSTYLSTLARCEEALAASDEAVRTLGPYFLAHPTAFEDWMDGVVRNYVQHASDAGCEPDLELLAPIQIRLAELASGPLP